jgi:hypothetical protein
MMEAQLSQRPTAAGIANMVQVMAVGGNVAGAWTALTEALAKWPDDASLLYAGLNIATISSNIPRKLEYVNRLAEREPDNAWLQGLRQQTENEAAEPAVNP